MLPKAAPTCRRLLVGGLLSLASDANGVGALLGYLELDEEGVAGPLVGGLVPGEGELVVGAGATVYGAAVASLLGCAVGSELPSRTLNAGSAEEGASKATL